MAQNYTRQSSFSDGDTITSSLFNNEYNQIVNAFTYSSSSDSSTGHKHDGNAGQGGNIPQIGDIDFNNKIVVDGTNNRWGVFVEVSGSAVEQIRIQDGAIVPVTDSDIDLGTSSLEFKDLFLDGTAHIDTLDVDVNATVAGTLGVTGATTLSSTLGVTGAITGSSTVQGTTITATTAFVPDASDGAALGTSALEFSDLFLADGAVINFGADQDVSLTHVADTGLLLSSTDQLQFGDSGTYIYQSADGVLDLVSDTEIEINATTIDINGAADVSGNLAVGGNLTVTGNATIAGNLTFGDAATDTVAFSADVASNLLPSADNTYDLGAAASEWKDLYIDGTANIDSLVADTADINGGTVDSAIIGGTTPAAITGTAITATGIMTATGTSVFASLDISGDIDVDGTTNLDVVDIDGAVNFASTTAHAGNATFADNARLQLGTGTDLQIYHSGSDSYIADNGDGDLYISGSDNIIFRKSGSSEVKAKMITDGAVELYYDNAVKLATTATGIDVTGVITTDGMTTSADINFGDSDKAVFGAGSDLQIYHDGSNSHIQDNGTGNLIINGTEVRILSDDTSEYSGRFITNGAVELYYDSAIKFATTSTGIDVTGTATMDGLTSSGDVTLSGASSPTIRITDTTNTCILDLRANDSDTLIRTTSNHPMILNTNQKDRIQIASNGDVSFYEDTGTTAKFEWSAANERLTLTGSDYQFGIKQGANQPWYTRAVSDGSFRLHLNGTGDVLTADASGNVGINTSSPSFSGFGSSTGGIDITNTTNAALRLDGNAADAMFIVSGSGQHWFYGKGAVPMTFSTDGTERLRIAAAGNVTVRTDTAGSPTRLSVSNGGTVQSGTAARLSFYEGATETSYIERRRDGSGVTAFVTSADDNPIVFESAGSIGEFARFDSGNLLVGKTSASSATVGFQAGQDGFVAVTRASAQPLVLNRTTSDGTILDLRRDGAVIGSIGTLLGGLYIADGGVGLRFDSGGTDDIFPCGVAGAAADASINLGSSGARFKDLYLSSGVNVLGDSASLLTQLSLANASTDVTSGSSIDFQTGSGSTTTSRITSAYSSSNKTELIFSTYNSGLTESMRISDGNLLVGTTDTTLWSNSGSGEGIALMSGSYGGYLVAARDDGTVFEANRLSTDGIIANFRKDGSTVGGIGASGGSVYIGGYQNAGLYFNGTTDVRPWNTSTQANLDASIDLGNSSARFKDVWISNAIKATSTIAMSIPVDSGAAIQMEFGNNDNTVRRTAQFYKDMLRPADADDGDLSLGDSTHRWKDAFLSGGIYLGGTAAANKLDDYEEGTWTPVINGATGASATAYYTKVGNVVHFRYYSQAFTSTAVAAQISGLPFTADANATNYTLFNAQHNTATTSASGGYIQVGGTTMHFVNQFTVSSPTFVAGTGRYLMVAGFYTTAS